MIEGLASYPAYKESGLAWMPVVPGHWDLVPNRALVRKRKVLVGERHAEFPLLSLTKQGVIVRDVASGKGKFSSDMGTSQEVRVGDFVFCLFDVPETPRTVGLSAHAGMITGAYTVFESRQPATRSYFELFYLTMDDQKLLSPLYSGLRNTIPPERFLGTKMPLPPPDEQAAIVRFLDHANRRIDQFIRAKRKLIALLNEQKQAIIHRAVTRGLDPSVPMKDSGVAWLGEVPGHWAVLPLKRLSFVISKGTTPSTEGQNTFDTGPVRFLKAENIAGGRVVDRPEFFITNATHELLRRSKLLAGDVLFVIAGATLGKTAVVRQELLPANTNQAVAFIRPTSRIHPDFLATWLQSPRIRQQIWLNAVQSAQPNLAMGALGLFQTPVPPLQEQTSILAGLQLLTAGHTTGLAQAERQIALLREYRTRLISDVVTGQFDVRAAAATLPADLPPAAEEVDLDDEADLGEDTEVDEEVA